MVLRHRLDALPGPSGARVNDDDDGRRGRLRIIAGITIVVFVATLAVRVVGSRMVAAEVADIEERASTATLDPGEIAIAAYGDQGDPVSEALDVDPTGVSMIQRADGTWCVSIEVSRLASSRSVWFGIDDAGQFVAVAGCSF